MALAVARLILKLKLLHQRTIISKPETMKQSELRFILPLFHVHRLQLYQEQMAPSCSGFIYDIRKADGVFFLCDVVSQRFVKMDEIITEEAAMCTSSNM